MTRLTLRLLILSGAAVLVHGLASAQQIHRNGFEALKTVWAKGGSDAPYDEKAHAVTDATAHDGKRSEYLSLDTKPGTFIHYQYATGKALIGEELSAGVWLKANRPGVQVLARVVLPKELDPNNLGHRLTTYLRGDTYQKVGQWQQLNLPRPVQLAKQQQQLMQAQLKRSINFDGAYIDALVLNVYTGPGPVELWVDDLEIGPLSPDVVAQPAVRPSGPTEGTLTNIPRATDKLPLAEFKGNMLTVDRKPFLFRAVRWTDTPLRVLRDAGFNTVVFDGDASDALLKEAADLGLWVVPQVRVLAEDGKPLSPDEISRQVGRYAGNDGVLFHRLKGVLAYEQALPVSRATQQIRSLDPGRGISADVWDGLQPYSRSVNMLGIYRWPLMTTLELPKYREWLTKRRDLATPGAFMWTWVQTHLPESTAQALYDRPAAGAFQEPIGPQAEQIRLVAYSALASGCRGLAFWSDRFLADSHQGRDRLLCCALLNQELDMLEPLLVTVDDAPQWIDTSAPAVKAAVMRTAKGVLVMPIWQGKFAQFVPGQAATKQLSMIVPMVPQSTQAWEITPGEVHGLKTTREHGGTKITLQEFGLTSAVLFTSDTKLVADFQDQVRRRRQIASQYSFDMAVYELEKAVKVHEQLEQMGHTLPDARVLLADTQKRLATAKQMWDSRLFAEAYRESERALRPVRILMRAQWEQAVRGLDTPAATPYAATYYTLPKHHQMMDLVKRSAPAPNQLPGGDFEIVPERGQSWFPKEMNLDELDVLIQRVGEAGPDAKAKAVEPKEGKHCALLQIMPDPKKARPQALERTMVALKSAPVKLPPGTVVQISGWVHIPEPITASPDGALFYDSAGDEGLAIRLTEPTAWKKYTFYRKVPASGQIHVTLALTGLGKVYFDDVRVEPLLPPNRTAALTPGDPSPRP